MKLRVHVSFLLLGLALLADTAVRANLTSTSSAAAAKTTGSSTTTPKSTTTTTTPTTMPEQHETNSTETPSSSPSANKGGNAKTNETGSQLANATSEQTSPADNSTGTSTTTATATNVENTSQKETSPSVTTLSTAAGTTSSGKTENASSSTILATPTGNGTSPVPDSTSKTSVATPANMTTKPTSTSPSTHFTNVSAPASTPSNATPGATTTTTTTTASTTPPTSSIIISETNLLLASDSFFVELKGATSASLNNLTLAVFDANTTEVAYNITYNSTTALNATTSLCVQPIDETMVQNLVSVAVVLYRPKSYMGKFTDTGLQDYVVFSLRPNAIAQNIKEALLKDTAATIVRKGLTASGSTPLSLSRCTDVPRDSSVFFATRQSRGKANACPLISISHQLMLQLHLKAKNCMPSADDTETIKQQLQMKLVSEINQRCRCGLSTRQINSNLTCARDLYLEFKVSPSFNSQAEKFTTAFKLYVQNPNNTQRFGEQYAVVSCWQDCRKSGVHHLPGSKNNNGNISVTVAVVLSCVAVFLLILVAVIIYMRRKRHGIMRQFRMTRLQEDDDMDDMEDFIGGGLEQEPSFNSSRNNLTS